MDDYFYQSVGRRDSFEAFKEENGTIRIVIENDRDSCSVDMTAAEFESFIKFVRGE